MEKKQSNNSYIHLIGVSVLFLLIGFMYLNYLRYKPIDLNEFVTIQLDGIEGYATLNVSFDYDSFKEKYEDEIVFKNDSSSSLSVVEDGIHLEKVYDTSNGEGYSNGDSVTYSWKIDDVVNSKIKNSFVYKNIDYKVEGLQAVEAFDPFEKIEVTFSGIEPDGKATLVNNYTKTDKAYNLTYVLDKKDGLSNGDTVVVSIEYNDAEDVVAAFSTDYGVAPSSLTKEFKVADLSSGVIDSSQISINSLRNAISQGEDQIRSDEANGTGEWEVQSVKRTNTYLCTEKYGDERSVILVYKITGRYTDSETGDSATFDFYRPILYKDLVLENDGTVSFDYQNYETCTDNYMAEVELGDYNRTFYVTGFDTETNLYKKFVESKLADYSIERIED